MKKSEPKIDPVKTAPSASKPTLVVLGGYHVPAHASADGSSLTIPTTHLPGDFQIEAGHEGRQLGAAQFRILEINPGKDSLVLKIIGL